MAACINIAAWMPPVLAVALLAGAAIGFSIRFSIDYAELATYRAIARRSHATQGPTP